MMIKLDLSDPFQRELQDLREALLRMAGQVEAQIERALIALRDLDEETARAAQADDRLLNEAYRQLRERCFGMMSSQQLADRELRLLLGIQYIAVELERMGDYAVRIARRTCQLAQLPRRQLRAEFGIMRELATQQVRDILDALIENDAERAREVAGHDSEIDRLYDRVFDDLVQALAAEAEEHHDPDQALRTVILIQAAHDLERIGDRVTNVAEDIVFLESGSVVELG
jgi:phosphate transport system protein